MRIAVTGGIAEGKSTVLGYLDSLGVSTFSADCAAREVFDLPDIQSRIAAELGLPQPVSKSAVREAVDSNSEARRALNRVMHPAIWERVRKSRADVAEVPLLFEACLHLHFARVWVVTCGEREQLSRLARRLGSEVSARSFLSRQLPTAMKCAFADRVVRTNESEGTVLAYVTQAIAQDLQLGN